MEEDDIADSAHHMIYHEGGTFCGKHFNSIFELLGKTYADRRVDTSTRRKLTKRERKIKKRKKKIKNNN